MSEQRPRVLSDHRRRVLVDEHGRVRLTRYDPKVIAQVRRCKAQGLTPEAIAAVLGLTRYQVRRMAQMVVLETS